MPLTNHQLDLRKNHLGASETPVVLGLSPYSMTPRDIYWKKVANIEPPPAPALVEEAGAEKGADDGSD